MYGTYYLQDVGKGRKQERKLYLQDVGKGREHDCMEAGGRATQEAKAEERKLFPAVALPTGRR